jgi:hypothetical protein
MAASVSNPTATNADFPEASAFIGSGFMPAACPGMTASKTSLRNQYAILSTFATQASNTAFASEVGTWWVGIERSAMVLGISS